MQIPTHLQQIKRPAFPYFLSHIVGHIEHGIQLKNMISKAKGERVTIEVFWWFLWFKIVSTFLMRYYKDNYMSGVVLTIGTIVTILNNYFQLLNSKTLKLFICIAINPGWYCNLFFTYDNVKFTNDCYSILILKYQLLFSHINFPTLSLFI